MEETKKITKEIVKEFSVSKQKIQLIREQVGMLIFFQLLAEIEGVEVKVAIVKAEAAAILGNKPSTPEYKDGAKNCYDKLMAEYEKVSKTTE